MLCGYLPVFGKRLGGVARNILEFFIRLGKVYEWQSMAIRPVYSRFDEAHVFTEALSQLHLNPVRREDRQYGHRQREYHIF